MRTRSLIIAAGFAIAATIAASAAAAQEGSPTFGIMPDDAFIQPPAGRSQTMLPGMNPYGIDMSRVPDFVETTDQAGDLVGYVKKTELFPTTPDGKVGLVPSVQKVYSRDGKTVVGSMYPGRGFVRAGQRPEGVPTVPMTVVARP